VRNNLITTIHRPWQNVSRCHRSSRAAQHNCAVKFQRNNWLVDNVWIQHVTDLSPSCARAVGRNGANAGF